MKKKIVAWAALAGGADHATGKYCMTVSASTRSAAKAKSAAADEFTKAWPGVLQVVAEVTAIREGD